MILAGLLAITAGLFLLRTAFAPEPDPRILVAEALGLDSSAFAGPARRLVRGSDLLPDKIDPTDAGGGTGRGSGPGTGGPVPN